MTELSHQTSHRRGRGARAPLAVLGGAAVAALATACGSTASSAEPSTPPADAYVELVLGTSQEQAVQKTMAAEELVAACMTQQGFDYVPDISRYTFPDEAAVDPPPGSREFAESYGYGFVEGPPVSESAQGSNPNDEIMASLGPEGRARYMEALYGASTEESDAAPQEYDWRNAGCMGAALHETSPEAAQNPVAVALQEEIARIEATALPADPRVVALDDAWATCMADSGYEGLARQGDAAAQATDAWMAYQASVAAGNVDPDRDDGDVAAEEKALALADWDCRDEVRYDAGIGQVRTEMQSEYVKAHRAELDAWVEASSDRS